MTPKDVLKLAKEKGAKIIDLRFIDLPGLWQHFSIPMSELKEDIFEEGLGFDGSSIRGFQTIDESDMLLIPDPSTAQMDPFTAVPTLDLICNVKDPVTGKPYTRDPRYIAQKAEAYLKKTGVGDTIYIGPELEFFFFDSIRFDQNYNSGYYFIDSEAGLWKVGQDGHLHAQAAVPGQRLRHAHAPVDLEERQEPLLRARRLRRHLEELPLLHRRHPQARPGAARADRAVDQLIQAARAGLRGADQPRLQPAQPLGVRAHPGVLEDRRVQANRVPDARQHVQPLSVVRGVHDGGSGRNREQDRPGQAGGQGSLRAAAGRGEENQAAAGRARHRARQSRGEPRLAAQGRRLHARRDRDVARLQAEERGRPGAAASAPVGVRALL